MPEQSPQWLAGEGAVFLLAAAVVGMLARRLGVPYAVALVLGGLLTEETHIANLLQLDPRLVLFGFLPPLLFDAAFHLDPPEARQLLRPILLLALPGGISRFPGHAMVFLLVGFTVNLASVVADV